MDAQTHLEPTSLRVLLVDDHEDSREGYAAYLRISGAHVDTAANGREGITKARELQPDVIVMDLNMPEVDGWRAIRWLKRKRRTRSIPVIAMSARIIDSSEEVRAREAGFDAACRKPCLPSKLVALIRGMLRARKEEQASRDPRSQAFADSSRQYRTSSALT